MTQQTNLLVALDDLAVVRIDGADAVAFLHGQVSNDIAGMGQSDARLAAYCTPKGRMLGNLVFWRETADPGSPLLALIKADLSDSLIKRLRMFVMRSKVTLERVDLKVHGKSGPDLAGEASAWRVSREDRLTRITAPASLGGLQRTWLIGDVASVSAEDADASFEAQAVWHAQDIEAGLGWVEHANQEMFIPQSLNYDLSGGVSFTKGCYPGQEIVARAHFRGTVKRRAVAMRTVLVSSDIS
jgi:folate-binding protein YgfZ